MPEGPGTPIDLLADLVLASGERLTPAEVVGRAGVDRDVADRLWRAMGFPDVPEDDRALSEDDVVALQRVAALVASGVVDTEAVVQVARTLGQAMARIADTIAGTVTDWMDESGVRLGDGDVEEAVAPLAGRLLPELDALVVYLLHRHLVAAASRRLETGSPTEQWQPMTVGFADVVGFTALSREVSQSVMAGMVSRFESVAGDVVVQRGARVVKMIGDEVMFAAASVEDGAAVALDLADVFAHDPDVPEVRVGLGCGPVLARHGDLYGPVVNLAARAVAAARPGTVLVSEEVARDLDDSDGYVTKRVRGRRLKGVGRTDLFVLRRPS